MKDRRPQTEDRDLSAVNGQSSIVIKYLDLLDTQRETVFAALEGITDSQLWQRPAPKEWSIGEILSKTSKEYLHLSDGRPLTEDRGLPSAVGRSGKKHMTSHLDHNYLLFASFLPAVKLIWQRIGWYGRLRRKRPYKTEVEDLYRSPKFPQWVGFLWTPRYNKRKPVPFEALKTELCDLHMKARRFYEGKDEEVLGNLHLYDPLFGWCNLIVTLQIGVYHDQLHYDDVMKQAKQFR